MHYHTFDSLKKNVKKAVPLSSPEYHLAILGDCATQHLETAIKGIAYEYQINLNVFNADYNQVELQIVDFHSEFYQFKPDCTLIQLCTEKLQYSFYQVPDSERYTFADTIYKKIKYYWDSINQKINTKIIQFNFPEADDGIFGNYANKTKNSFLYQIRRLNLLLMEGCQQYKYVYIMDLNHLQSVYGRSVLLDPKFYFLAKMPISLDILPVVAGEIMHIIQSLLGQIKKCVIIDLDGTIWGGVIGDDGINGIQIGELGTGQAYTAFQIWLKELKNRGILLAVCSKNQEDTAKEPFQTHPDMILHLADISIFIANWDDKATNIKRIQQVLQIGMDSMVFLDDNPFERNLVRNAIPDITVPELPDDPALYLTYLQNLNLFETASYSDEDSNRTEQYQAQAKRASLETKYQSYHDYLNSLEMKAVVKPFDTFHYPRIAQLTQRSNQFNLRTIRYTEADIERISNDPKYISLYFSLSDRFGDYGLVSVVILEKKDSSNLFLDTWLMSCRVLNRGMEEFVINKVVNTAKENGFRFICGEYIPTAKNKMVANIFLNLGFYPVNNYFEADVNNFKSNITTIIEGE